MNDTTNTSPRTSPAVQHLRAVAQRLEQRVEKLIDQALALHYAQVDIQERLARLEQVQ